MPCGIFYSQLHLNGGVLILYNSCMESFPPDAPPLPGVQHLSHFQYLVLWGMLLWAFLHRSLFSNRIISQEWKFGVKRNSFSLFPIARLFSRNTWTNLKYYFLLKTLLEVPFILRLIHYIILRLSSSPHEAVYIWESDRLVLNFSFKGVILNINRIRYLPRYPAHGKCLVNGNSYDYFPLSSYLGKNQRKRFP